MVYNTYNFSGKPTSTYKTHNISGQSTVTELYTYSYDHALRPLVTNYYLNGGNAVTLASNIYDELGRLKIKITGGADATSYTYNIRGWLKDITGSKFTENLYYNANTANLPNFTPAYNGNIAGMKWYIANENLGYSRAYSFTYDGLNRLTDATYAGLNSDVLIGTLNRYDEHFLFDKMGNTTSFTRNGLQSGLGGYGTIDNLSFTYQGNQKIKTTDLGTNGIFYGDEEFVQNTANSGNSCAYDANGNRLYDSDSNIWGIRYNTLNLPDAMQFYQGHQTIYTYSAAGAKLRVVDKTAPEGVTLPVTNLNTILTNPTASATTTTDYVGNIIYENGTLKRILTPVGYWQGGTYYYFLKDHLGSNRLVITDGGAVVETSSYYPSGMRFGESTVSGGNVQPYRHTGHEMQQMHGLNWIDNLARFRTVSDGGGFTGVDPLAELMPGISPYAYCYNNPIKYIDPLGLAGEDENIDMWGRNRIDPFTGMYIAPMDRPGGTTAKGYGDTNYGHWEPNKVHKQYSYTIEDKGSSAGRSSVTVGYDEYDYSNLNFVWNSSEERMYGNPSGGGSWLTAADHANNGIGGFSAGMSCLGGNFRINNNSGFSPKFYTKPNAAGKIFNGGFGIKTYNTTNWGKGIGYGALGVSVVIGGVNVYSAIQKDGGTYGANTQMAVAKSSLGIAGAWAGAEIGAAIGVWFGGIGAIPGAVIGGVIGGVVGGWGGSKLGETVVNNFSSY